MGRQTESGSGLPQGFDPPSSNVTWCPNQFFDVVLPHFPRGVVRLVGYLLWQTLAWNDATGRPKRLSQRLTWEGFAKRANVSRGALGEAIEAGIAGRLIARAAPDPQRRGAPAYALRWATAPYTRDPAAFEGFFLGRGHRTYVPNQFFTVVVAREPLALTRVVGAVIRYSIGFEAEHGYRRTDVALSCRRLAALTHLSERAVVDALQAALAAGYLRRVRAGRFGRHPAAARYALRWADGFESAGSPARPARRPAAPGRPGSSKSSVAAVQKSVRGEFKNFSSLMEEMKPIRNEILTKPDGATGHVDDPDARRRRLREIGFSGRSAAALAQYPQARIERQIAWLSGRAPARNPLGLLRRAIEEDWSPPRSLKPVAGAPALPSSGPVDPPHERASEPSDREARSAYTDWMRGELLALERDETRATAFRDYRDQLKTRLRPLHRDRPEHGILRRWDSESTRLAHLREFDATLPDFEAWSRRAAPPRQTPSSERRT